MSESGKIPKSKEPETEDPDGVIKKFENDSPGQNGSKKDLLDSFLKQISGAVSLHSKASINEFEDIQSVEFSEYPEHELSPDLDRKITELKLIADSIEKKKAETSNDSYQNFSKFKVNYINALNPAQLAAVLLLRNLYW